MYKKVNYLVFDISNKRLRDECLDEVAFYKRKNKDNHEKSQVNVYD